MARHLKQVQLFSGLSLQNQIWKVSLFCLFTLEKCVCSNYVTHYACVITRLYHHKSSSLPITVTQKCETRQILQWVSHHSCFGPGWSGPKFGPLLFTFRTINFKFWTRQTVPLYLYGQIIIFWTWSETPRMNSETSTTNFWISSETFIVRNVYIVRWWSGVNGWAPAGGIWKRELSRVKTSLYIWKQYIQQWINSIIIYKYSDLKKQTRQSV